MKVRTIESDTRRLFQRFEVDGSALVRIAEEWHRVECVDLSAGGLAVQSELRPDAGSLIDLHVETLGRFKGRILKHTDAGFVIELETSDFVQNQLNEELDEKADGD
ncbi:PilZ domain-containing protein [Kiloniella sp. b19]|uniref:PilZ domain-containing protein n=1 Tax=Kiloniella sp. GXU_MW_B19 TaxID=3141326 RepID=UPI0031E04057